MLLIVYLLSFSFIIYKIIAKLDPQKAFAALKFASVVLAIIPSYDPNYPSNS